MNPQLADLPFEDILLPPEPSAWPPGPAWWLLGGLLLLLLIVCAVWVIRWRRSTALRRAALAQIRQLDPGAQDFAHQLNALLKRNCLALYPRRNVAKLHGEQWWAFLQSTIDEKHQPHIQPLKALSRDNRFAPAHPGYRHQALQQAGEFWLRYAKQPANSGSKQPGKQPSEEPTC